MPLITILLTTLLWIGPLPSTARAAEGSASRPKLILTIMIDQFRADYLMRFESRFRAAQGAGGEVGGFRYLMTQGAYYPYAQYDILQSMTGPGHATILSGSYPYQFQIPTNIWFSQKYMEWEYCVEDRDTPQVGAPPVNAHVGTSPKNFRGSTVGDELKNAGYPSRVMTVALKDRAAILMGGKRADLALWFDNASWKWVSSRYYLPEGKLPPWVDRLNEQMAKVRGSELTWDKQGEGTGFTTAKPLMLHDAYNERAGKEFPHKTRAQGYPPLNTPYGLDITVDAASRMIDEYRLGSGKSVDILAVSFSAHDYAGHAFGPNSREMEEMTVADDRAISELLNHVRKAVPGGLKNVLVVLSGDHGVSSSPEYLKPAKVDSDFINAEAMLPAIEERLVKKFGKVEGKWVPYTIDLNFYLNEGALKAKGVDRTLVENEIREFLTTQAGVAHVITRGDYVARHLPPLQFERQILKTYVLGRSGDVIIIPKPFYFEAGDTTNHMTGYFYDRTVPLILAGPHVRPGRYSQRAEVVDVAPTLSYLAGSMAPALSEGRVLSEAIRE